MRIDAEMPLVRGSSELGPLADPRFFRGALDIDGVSAGALLRWLRSMMLIRVVEEAIGDLVTAGEAKCPCHLAIGQEAIPVGVSEALRATDRVFGNHRSHAQYLALGGDPYRLIAEVLGKAEGASRGMGGSMHLFAGEYGFLGSVPIVAGTVPFAVGAGLAAKMDGRGDVGVAYFGDGACEEGVVHESLNLAAIYRLPVLFVCENNLFSSHMDVSIRQPSDRMARFAEAHRIASEVVDGNDVVAVSRAASRLVAKARAGAGPGFLEGVTYRWRGHVGPREDIDVGLHRSTDDLAAWKKRDPIQRLIDALVARGDLFNSDVEAMRASTNGAVSDAVVRSREAAWPPTSALLDHVYVAR
jgi:acetoin:2,6-dichlorophenolindophenol oxidoreductase subunit alpha